MITGSVPVDAYSSASNCSCFFVLCCCAAKSRGHGIHFGPPSKVHSALKSIRQSHHLPLSVISFKAYSSFSSVFLTDNHYMQTEAFCQLFFGSILRRLFYTDCFAAVQIAGFPFCIVRILAFLCGWLADFAAPAAGSLHFRLFPTARLRLSHFVPQESGTLCG